MTSHTVQVIAALIVLFWLINIGTYMLFRADHRRARLNDHRIPGSTLLLFALAGGVFGAKLGQRVFRHQPRRDSFPGVLNLILALYIGLAALLLHPQTRPMILTPLGEASEQLTAFTASLPAAQLQITEPEPERQTPRFFQRAGN